MKMHTSNSSDSDCNYATVSSAPPKRRAGRTKFRETRHPIYKGVRQRGRGGAARWVCEVREPNKKSRIWLGTYATAEMAARAHDVAAIALRGRLACLNFADSAWRLPVPESASAGDIRRAAAMAAESFRPEEGEGEGEEKGAEAQAEGMVARNAASATSATSTPMNEALGGEYFDEEFAMEGSCYYYARMAEALLVDPPPMICGVGWDDVDGGAELSLWSYSI